MMLKINTNFKRCKILLISGVIAIGGIFLFSYLTFIPNQTFAAYDWETRKLSDITTMQEMNAKICENTEIGYTKQLVDARKDISGQMQTKKYWVAKLADGKCWMTQNLDFDIPSTLDPATSDVASSTSISAQKFTNSTTVASWNTGDATTGKDLIQYYDPGLMVKSNPAGTDNCSGSGKTALNQSDCTNAGWRDVSGLTAETTTSSNGNNSVDTSSSVINGSSYDAHYLVGNYYSWNAATAGSGSAAGDVQGTQAANSICPKGWKLPTASNKLGTGTTNNTVIPAGTGNSYDMAGSFAYLFRQYGLATSYNAGSVTGTANSQTYNIYDAPLYYFRAGSVHSANLNNAGSNGYYGSSVVNSATLAYLFYFNTGTSFYPSHNNGRYDGMPVRCVANPNIYPEKPILADNQANVAITVSPIINLDVAKSADDMVVDFNSIDTSTIDINVSSNQKYQVTLTTDQPNLTPHKSDNSEYSIKMVGTSGGVVEKGKNGWGIKKKLSATNDSQLGSLVNEPTYSPIGINNDQITFYRSAGPEALTNQTDPANPLQLEVGVSVDQSLPSDTYSTMVTVTAMAY